jgi:hypothetical protein
MHDLTSIATPILISGLFLIIILTSNIVQGQQTAPKTQQKTTALSSSIPAKLHAVKITSPAKGQQVIVGTNLTVSGISLNNPNSNCQVSVIVNGVKPYQPATATGIAGSNDYSKWNFLLISKYTTIKPGPNNRITAKYTCLDNPTIISFYSVNVTGVNVLGASSLPTTVTSPQGEEQLTHNKQNTTTTNYAIANTTAKTLGNIKVATYNTSTAISAAPISGNSSYLADTKFFGERHATTTTTTTTTTTPPTHGGIKTKTHDNSNTFSTTTKHHKSKAHHIDHKSIGGSPRKFRFDPFDFPIYG